MSSQLLLASAATVSLVIASGFIMRRLLASIMKDAKSPKHLALSNRLLEPTILSENLTSALPDSIILPRDAAFKRSMNSYWAQQECEVIPACVVRPGSVEELCKAIKIIKYEFDARDKQKGVGQGLFAIRSGGHCPVPGAASIENGVVIDLSLICEVKLSQDGSSVTIGTGAKWMDVSQVLDRKGLAVVGGRSSAVGVGGLTLGGGLSFFSSRFGFVCSNIVSYELVLASGSIITASASTNSDLWRALKGGSNNFGVVTRFTARSFPSTNIWSGFLYMPGFQATKALAAFHESLNQMSLSHDDHVAGPIACFSYIQMLRMQTVAVNLIYTEPPKGNRDWPPYWKNSKFGSMWRLWSTCKVRTLTSATDEAHALNPPGRRQLFVTTTIKNDAKTLNAAYTAYYDAISSLRHVKGLVWTLVLQPLLPSWARKGDANSLGLDDSNHEPLVIINFTINWLDRTNDDFVKVTARQTIEQIDLVATTNKTGHRFRNMNYCARWQQPFEGYGEDNLRFLQEVSKRHDPERLFQHGCVGGFKLDTIKDTT